MPRGARGTEDIRLSGGRGRLDVWGRDVRSLDDILAAMNGGDHLNDLVVKGFGRTRLLAQDVQVSGKGGFSIQVV